MTDPIPFDIITDPILRRGIDRWRQVFTERHPHRADLAGRAETLAYLATSGHTDYQRGVYEHLTDALRLDHDYWMRKAERLAWVVLVDGYNGEGGELRRTSERITKAEVDGASPAYIEQEQRRLGILLAIHARLCVALGVTSA